MGNDVAQPGEPETYPGEERENQVEEQYEHDQQGAWKRDKAEEQEKPGMKELLLGLVKSVFCLVHGSPYHQQCQYHQTDHRQFEGCCCFKYFYHVLRDPFTGPCICVPCRLSFISALNFILLFKHLNSK